MRALSVVAVALLLVVAGCGSPGGSGTPTGTADSPTASPASTTGNDSGAASLPGVTDGQLTDPAALADAHEAALLNDSFETRLVVNATERVPTSSNGSAVVNTSTLQQVVAEEGGRPYQYRLQNRKLGSQFDVWANDSVEVTRAMQGGTVFQYKFGQPQSTASVTGANVVRSYLSLGNYTVTNTTTRDGATLVTLSADELAADERDGLFVRRSENVSNYSSTVVVDGEGRVRSLDVRAEYTVDGKAGAVDVSYRLVRVGGVETQRPDWVATAYDQRARQGNASG
ncbi:DUF7537 family lipoprotein [Halomarina litorea]|uniref:DUF7537 family lipoprotein n=1 Tax=Halomarina litorea TaxID=2961595 RepID=UPI0020C52046|nr:hypothetical protein [Halomarina sp. BCD28]